MIKSWTGENVTPKQAAALYYITALMEGEGRLQDDDKESLMGIYLDKMTDKEKTDFERFRQQYANRIDDIFSAVKRDLVGKL